MASPRGPFARPQSGHRPVRARHGVPPGRGTLPRWVHGTRGRETTHRTILEAGTNNGHMDVRCLAAQGEALLQSPSQVVDEASGSDCAPCEGLGTAGSRRNHPREQLREASAKNSNLKAATRAVVEEENPQP